MIAVEVVWRTLRELGLQWRFHLTYSLPCALMNVLLPVVFARAFGVEPTARMDDPHSLTAIVIALTITMFGLFSWGTVALLWHRLVLLGRQKSTLDLNSLGRLPRYMGLLVIVSIKVCLALLPLVGAFVIVMIVAQTSGSFFISSWEYALDLAVKLAASYFVMRWSLALPACAIGSTSGTADAWNASRKWAKPILAVALTFGLFDWLTSPPNAAGRQDGLSINFLMPDLYQVLWYVASGWTFAMVGIALLTTLYARLPAAEVEAQTAA
jgi:hypothetical protein